MADLIEPRTLKGFRDYLPDKMIPREWLLEQARRVCRSYGFAPIDTPALEYAEVLLAKAGGETEPQSDAVKQVYRFNDRDKREVALRFDLTVPFARFAAKHLSELKLPFKRYHFGPVWRGETPGAGRFREFWQCDFDTIGTTANGADTEVALVIYDLMKAVLRSEDFQIQVNNRLVLNGLLEEFGLAAKSASVLIVLDKLPKVGREGVIAEMAEKAGIDAAGAGRILDLAAMQGTSAENLDRLQRDYGGNAKTAEGVRRLRELVDVTRTAGVPESCLRLNLSIARGLDYYTGTIYETFLNKLPGIGSVCSGGRYDNLAGLYTKQQLPGVGASLGLDRLLEAMVDLDLLPKVSTPAPVLMTQFSAERLGDYQKMARALRGDGVGVEVFPEAKKVGQQLAYAEKRGFRVALIAGPDDFAQGVWKVKDLAQRVETAVPAAEVAAAIRRLLGT
jgi:histidyl-tRNA synthetase